MLSPFVYEEPVAAGDLVGRGDELELLRDRALDGRNTRVEGPRRFGKTSLLRGTLQAARADGLTAIEVNFLGCVTAADVAERIERAYAAQLDSALRRWFSGVVRTWRPSLEAKAPGTGVGVGVAPQVAAPGLLDRLALPRQIFERTGRACVIAFDEFQEVVRIAPSLPGVFRSELETHGPAASYLFSGSHPGLMRDLFADRRHAFFSQATPVTLGRLPADALAEFITARFAEVRRDPGVVLDALLDLADGHPQRAMLLAHHLFQLTPADAAADPETWANAELLAFREAMGEIQTVWDAATTVQCRVLKAVSARSVTLSSTAATERFGLIKGSSTAKAADSLVADGHLVADATTASGLRVVDPLLASWLRGDAPVA